MSKSWPNDRTGPCNTIARSRSAAIPSSHDQSPSNPGTLAGEQEMKPEHQRRRASKVSELGSGVDPTTCPQTIGPENPPDNATPPDPHRPPSRLPSRTDDCTMSPDPPARIARDGQPNKPKANRLAGWPRETNS